MALEIFRGEGYIFGPHHYQEACCTVVHNTSQIYLPGTERRFNVRTTRNSTHTLGLISGPVSSKQKWWLLKYFVEKVAYYRRIGRRIQYVVKKPSFQNSPRGCVILSPYNRVLRYATKKRNNVYSERMAWRWQAESTPSAAHRSYFTGGHSK